MVLGLLVHVTSSNVFRRILRSEALVYKSFFFRTAVLRKLFDISFSYNHCNFSRVCLLVKMALKTMTRSITVYFDSNFDSNFVVSQICSYLATPHLERTYLKTPNLIKYSAYFSYNTDNSVMWMLWLYFILFLFILFIPFIWSSLFWGMVFVW